MTCQLKSFLFLIKIFFSKKKFIVSFFLEKMFWTSLDDYSSTSSSDSEEFVDSIGTRDEYEVILKKKSSIEENEDDEESSSSSSSEKKLLSEESKLLCRAEPNSSPFIQVYEIL